MKVQCPKCAATYQLRLPDKHPASVSATCAKCQHRFSIAVTDKLQKARKKILIVDDARFFRELILDLLAHSPFELTTANCGEEAWNLLQAETFSLLIVDVNLPDISGLELIRRIRQRPTLSTMPVLCISGVYRQDDDARQAFIAGADDYMTKSFHPDDFTSRVDRLIGRRSVLPSR